MSGFFFIFKYNHHETIMFKKIKIVFLVLLTTSVITTAFASGDDDDKPGLDDTVTVCEWRIIWAGTPIPVPTLVKVCWQEEQ